MSANEEQENHVRLDRKPWIDAKRKRATAEDVARVAGVSRSAVSRSYTEGSYVSLEKKKRIREAAEMLGYRPNALAAGFNSNRSNLVAIVTGNLKNHYDSDLIGKLVEQLVGLEKLPVVIGGTSESMGDNEILEILDYPLESLVIRAGSVKVETVTKCLQLQVPVILSGRILDVGNVDSLCCDNAAGAEMAIEAFVKSGRKKIGYVGGNPDLFSEQERYAGFIAAMRSRGLEPAAIEQSDFSFEGGFASGLKILQAPERPDALFCGNDAMALGIMNAAMEKLGIRIPEEIAIIGFDDIEMARWPCFNLSTIRNPVDLTVEKIVALLKSRFANPARKGETVKITPKFIPRGTH